MSKRVSTRTALAVGIRMDLDKPVKVKLSLGDDRVIDVVAWSTNDEGGLLLVLDDGHDFFPVGRYVVGARHGEVVRRTATEHRKRGLYLTTDEATELRAVTTP